MRIEPDAARIPQAWEHLGTGLFLRCRAFGPVQPTKKSESLLKKRFGSFGVVEHTGFEPVTSTMRM